MLGLTGHRPSALNSPVEFVLTLYLSRATLLIIRRSTRSSGDELTGTRNGNKVDFVAKDKEGNGGTVGSDGDAVFPDGDFSAVVLFGAGGCAGGDGEDLLQEFVGEGVWACRLGEEAAGVEVDPAGFAGGEVGVGGDFDCGGGEAHWGAAAGGEEDEVCAGDGEGGGGDAVVAGGVDEGDAGSVRRGLCAVGEDGSDGGGAGFLDTAEGFFGEGGDAAVFVAGGGVLVDPLFVIDPVGLMTPARYLSSPGLWVGLAVAAVFLAAAVWLRRDREPI